VIGLVLEGWDGSVWDLRTGPVRVTSDGVEGLNGLTFDRFVQDTAMLDGQRFTGWRGKPRDFLLPVLLGPFRDAAQWQALSALWWRLMHPGKVNVLRITAPDGTVRMLDMRYVDDGGVASTKDPTRDLLEVYPIRMIADQPWYYGEDFGREFKGAPEVGEAEARNFFGGEPVTPGTNGVGTPLYLSPSKRDDVSTLTNPGDTDVWPILEFDAGMTRFTATIGTGVVAGSNLVVPVGSVFRVDMSPLRKAAELVAADGTRTPMTRRLSSFGFRPIPSGESSVLKLEVTSSSGYRVIAVPHYFRGW